MSTDQVNKEFSSPIFKIGTAGWHYKDWYGPVYPEIPPKDFSELDYYVSIFDMVEINSSFYNPPAASAARTWVDRVKHRPDFEFTAKLWRRFTHDQNPFSEQDIFRVREGLDPLMEQDKLGAVLIQFPWSFRRTPDNRKRLENVVLAFRSYPLVVEVRHASWNTPAFFEALNQAGIGITTVDQPVIGESIPFEPLQTGRVGYLRLHGRNYQNWFPKDKKTWNALTRYDYLYSKEETGHIAKQARTVSNRSDKTFVVFNNHPRGQAVANAAELVTALTDKILSLPDSMFENFPRLKDLNDALPV